MPTVYSDAHWTGNYTYTRVRVDYSGTSATAILLYTRTNTYSGATTTGSPASFSFGGGWADMAGKAFYGQQTDTEVCRCSFSISMGGGWYEGSTSGNAGYIAFSGGVSIPAQNTKPTGLSVSLAEVYTNGAKFNVSVSSYGTPSGVDGRYIEAGILNQSAYGPTYRYAIAYNTTSSAITVNNSSSGGSLTIQPNKRYYYGAYASNTAMADSKVQGQFVTKAEAPTVLFNNATSDSANFTFSVKADGGYYNRDVQYSLDNGVTWKTGATVTGGSAQSGTFTINGLLAGASYNIKTRISTTAGATEGDTVSFDTLVAEEDNRNLLYGSVNEKTKEIKVLYGSVNGEAKQITRFYGSAIDLDNFTAIILHTESIATRWGIDAFNPNTFKSKMISDHSSIWDNRNNFSTLDVKSFRNTSPRIYRVALVFKNNNAVVLVSGANSTVLATYGIHTTSLSPTSADTRDFVSLSPKQVARLVHQGFGHINYESES